MELRKGGLYRGAGHIMETFAPYYMGITDFKNIHYHNLHRVYMPIYS